MMVVMAMVMVRVMMVMMVVMVIVMMVVPNIEQSNTVMCWPMDAIVVSCGLH